MANLGYLFYKGYYKGSVEQPFDPRKFANQNDNDKVSDNNKPHFTARNQTLVNATLPSNPIVPIPSLGNAIFTCTTKYPGMLIGSGYTHETGSKGEFKLGFFFDHTTGLPIIPGSSVKGKLRSIFPSFPCLAKDLITIDVESTSDAVQHNMRISQEKADALWASLKNFNPAIFSDDDNKNKILHQLEFEIFEGVDWIGTNRAREKDSKAIVYFNKSKHDVFFDAQICNKVQDAFGRKIFYDDYLTSHRHQSNPMLDPFTEPNPLLFLRLMENVVFKFSFKLQSSVVLPALTSEIKSALFESVVTFIGMGAKTNTGYGQFLEGVNSAFCVELNSSVPSSEDSVGSIQDDPPPPPPQLPATIVLARLRNQDICEMTVVSADNQMVEYTLDGEIKDLKVTVRGRLPIEGTVVNVRIQLSRDRKITGGAFISPRRN